MRDSFVVGLLKVAAITVFAAGLAACGGGHGMTTPPPPPPPKLEDGFGGGFGNLFRAPANSEPAKPQSGDIKAVDPTSQPVLLH